MSTRTRGANAHGTPRVLIITDYLPAVNTVNAASQHVALEILRLARAGIDYDVVSIGTTEDIRARQPELPILGESVFRRSGLPHRFLAIRMFRFVFLLTVSIFEPLALYVTLADPIVRGRIRALLGERTYTHIHLQGIGAVRFASSVRRAAPRATLSVCLHNHEAEMARRRLIAAPPVAALAGWVISRVQSVAVEESDIVAMLSNRDAFLLKADLPARLRSRIRVVRPEMLLYWDEPPTASLKSLGFFGNLGRSENQEALLWFLKHVWPHLSGSGLTFKVGGRGAPRSLEQIIARYPDAVHIGYVKDLAQFIRSVDAMIAPLRKGGGVKFKVLQSLSASRVVLGTDLAFEGIDERRSLPRCESIQDYVLQIDHLQSNPTVLAQLQRESKKVAREFFERAPCAWEEIDVLRKETYRPPPEGTSA